LGQVQENMNLSFTCYVAVGQIFNFYLICNFQGVWAAGTGIKASANSITVLLKKMGREKNALVTR